MCLLGFWGSRCVTYWQANLLDTMYGGTSGESPVFWNDVGCGIGDIYPEVGVTGTPVIDPTTNTIYLVSSSTGNGENLNLLEYFTPDDQSFLAGSDTELGAGEPVLLPDQTSGPVLHLMAQMGKEGVIYLLNRDKMGHLQTKQLRMYKQPDRANICRLLFWLLRHARILAEWPVFRRQPRQHWLR